MRFNLKVMSRLAKLIDNVAMHSVDCPVSIVWLVFRVFRCDVNIGILPDPLNFLSLNRSSYITSTVREGLQCQALSKSWHCQDLLNRSQSLFYFVPQESHRNLTVNLTGISQSSWLD